MRMLGATGSSLQGLIDLAKSGGGGWKPEPHLDNGRAVGRPEEVVEGCDSAALEIHVQGGTVGPHKVQVLCAGDVKDLIVSLPGSSCGHDVGIVFELAGGAAIAADQNCIKPMIGGRDSLQLVGCCVEGQARRTGRKR